MNPVAFLSIAAVNPGTALRRPRPRVSLCAAVVAAGALACTAASLLPVQALAQAASPAPVRIGVVGPFTGPSADFGMPMLNGIRLAVEEINAVGGYLGRPLELVIKDDRANPDQGRKVSQELVNEKVVAAIGFCNTGVAMKAIDLF